MMSSGRLEDALECFDKILSKNPDESHALRNKAYCLYEFGEYNEALNFASRYIEIDPE